MEANIVISVDPEPKDTLFETQPAYVPAWIEFARLLDEYAIWRAQHIQELAAKQAEQPLQ